MELPSRPSIARARLRSNAITVTARVAAAGVAAAAGSASRSRSLPVLERKQRGKLRVLIFPRAPNARAGLSVQQDRNAATGSSAPTEMTGRTDLTDPIDLTEANAPNTGRLRATSQSFCRASRSPNISGWRRTNPCPSAWALRVRLPEVRALKLKRDRSLPPPISQCHRSPRFLPPTNLYSPTRFKRPRKPTKNLPRQLANQWMPRRPNGTASRSACTR